MRGARAMWKYYISQYSRKSFTRNTCKVKLIETSYEYYCSRPQEAFTPALSVSCECEYHSRFTEYYSHSRAVACFGLAFPGFISNDLEPQSFSFEYREH
jgi:hypothetical protein